MDQLQVFSSNLFWLNTTKRSVIFYRVLSTWNLFKYIYVVLNNISYFCALLMFLNHCKLCLTVFLVKTRIA